MYQVDRSLIAVPFDPSQLTRVGEPQTVETDVGAWGVSPGALAFGPPLRSRLSWKDRDGGVVPLPNPIPSHINYLTLSPDGRRAVLCLAKNNGRAHQLYRADLDGSANATPLTPGDDDWFGVFTPDGTRVLYTSAVHEGGSIWYNVFSTPADGSGAPVRLTTGPSWQKASAVKLADAGEVFLYNVRSLPGRGPGAAVPGTDHDIWQRHMDEPSGAQPLVATPGKEESEAAFSPDGRWIAYESDEAGRFDIYVKGYPDGPRTVVSPEGGGKPVWNPKTGGEVFYQKGTSVFAVTIVNGRRVGPAKRVFERGISPSRTGTGTWRRTASTSWLPRMWAPSASMSSPIGSRS